MPLRPPAGFISAFFDPLRNPDAPTIGTATAGDASASVTFTAPANVGGSAITAYYAVSNPGQVTVSGATSPISVTGLTNDTAYTFNVWALNSYGPGAFSAASNSVTPAQLLVALFAGGFSSGTTRFNTIDYVTITTTGNATAFGILTTATGMGLAGCGSTTRGLFGGGTTSVDTGGTSTITYVTFATTGNATSFGVLTSGRQNTSACSSSTRGVFAGGVLNGTTTSSINYVTIATTGNATSFGNLTIANYRLAGCSSPTRGIFAGGQDPDTGSALDFMNYITIATTGNGTTFGTLESTKNLLGSCSSSTRGLFGGGGGGTPLSISYVTIATTGNSVFFGNLSYGGGSPNGQAAASSELRGLFGGGSGPTNVINYVTIATTGNSTDFGDLTVARQQLGACSSASGGVQ